MIYTQIDHHVNDSNFYHDKQVLHKIRVLMFFVLAINWASGAFINGPVKFAGNFVFYTIWNETFVFLYFFCLVFLHPVTKRNSDFLVSFQHQVVVSQTIVVVVYWTILAPALGIDLGKGASMFYINCYKHSFPFLCIVHEFLVTYGLYKLKGIYVCMATLLVYLVLNITLALGFDKVVYPTKFTDPHFWQSYPMTVVNFGIVYGVGRLAMYLKKKLVVAHFAKTNGHLIAAMIGEDGEGPVTYS